MKARREQQFQDILEGTSHDPHGFLGLHVMRSGLKVRVFAPAAERAWLVSSGQNPRQLELKRTHEPGLFQLTLRGRMRTFAYRLQFATGDRAWEAGDPYRFLPTLGEEDLHYFNEGTHRRLWEVMGAQPRELDGECGVGFAVWAPSARAVSLVGDLNQWDARSLPMRSLGPSGVWELFVPGLTAGHRYKYSVLGADGVRREKADPFARAQELRPMTASVLGSVAPYTWDDGEWMAARAQWKPRHAPMSVYEVHLGSWRRRDDGSWLTYEELAEELTPYVRDLGFTHIELLPVAEHPFDGSWGYQVSGFYAPTSRFGDADGFRRFVDRMHQAGVGVLMDWVPAHFATDANSLAMFDGTHLYEHADPRKRVQPDWGTLAFNYGRHEVRNFLLANALYWLKEFHIDGLRVDAVSSMLYLDYSRQEGEWAPNRFGGRENLEAIDFLKEFNELVYGEGDGAITIAEESTAWPGVSRPTYAQGLGFGFKWNMGWMHDTLQYFGHNPVHRRYHQNVLTFSMMYAFSENFLLSLSHDEVVHGKGSLLHKMPGDEWQQFANLRLLFAYQHAMPGKKLLFMGDEFGQRSEWDHDQQLEWESLEYEPHAQVQRLVADLNRLHRTEPAFHYLDHEEAGFHWLDFADAEHSVIAFLRRGAQPEDEMLCAFNFTPVARYAYAVPAPAAGRYREILNTDSEIYGGGGVGNLGWAEATAREHLGSSHSLSLTLPPLGAVFLKRAST